MDKKTEINQWFAIASQDVAIADHILKNRRTQCRENS
jgi:hypothetical protein